MTHLEVALIPYLGLTYISRIKTPNAIGYIAISDQALSSGQHIACTRTNYAPLSGRLGWAPRLESHRCPPSPPPGLLVVTALG
eukprot:6188085-Pleurochrysis_carterae.AAC.2